MKSFDIFDTLIGRNYFFQDSIFREMEEKDMYPNFLSLRKQAEYEAHTKTLDGIYDKFAEITGIDSEAAQKLKSAELNLEFSRTFPIMTLLPQLEKDSILISDSFYTKDQLSKLLTLNGITPDKYADIVCSYDGKSSGRVWSSIRPEHHTGDNIESDVNSPRRNGINATHFSYSSLSEIEEKILEFGLPKLAALCRKVRLSNAWPDDKLTRLWEDQSDINIPLLVLISIHLHNTYESVGKELLFSERDCNILHKVYKILFPNSGAEVFYTSRECYSKATDTFIDYARLMYDPNKSVIVDLQGTGKSATSFFSKIFGKEPELFFVVYSDLNNTVKCEYLVHRASGFTDVIERLNYSSLGSVTDVVSGRPVRKAIASNGYVAMQQFISSMACSFLSKGHKIETELPNDYIVLIRYLLYAAEGSIMGSLVNHEEM